MSKVVAETAIVIRDINAISEMREVEETQKQVWGIEDREVFPTLALIPMIETGAILIGAFDGDNMAGFVFGFPGLENGRAIIHSDMLAVKPEYRSLGLGYRLKLAQRDRALANGIDTITWTFDPLQSLNAHLNIAKLGVIAERYRVNYYGETTSFLHSAGTDRLWVTWSLNSERVRRRIEFGAVGESMRLDDFPVAVRVGKDREPEIEKTTLENPAVVIEIPDNINLLKQENLRLALKWREATRQIFMRILDADYIVTEFYRGKRKGKNIGSYLLQHPIDEPFR